MIRLVNELIFWCGPCHMKNEISTFAKTYTGAENKEGVLQILSFDFDVQNQVVQSLHVATCDRANTGLCCK